jgi:malonyl CoA-acyl carrier protein transacylase
MMAEKFSIGEVAALRNELLSGGLDSFQAAEMVKMFLAGRGYGVSSEAALDAASMLEGGASTIDAIQKALDDIALVN